MTIIKILFLMFITYGIYAYIPNLKKNSIYVGFPILISGLVLFIYVFDLIFHNINIPIYFIEILGCILGTYNLYANRKLILNKKNINLKNIIKNNYTYCFPISFI